MRNNEMSLADAAHELGKTWAQTWGLLLTGALRGQKRGARWYVLSADVEALAAKAKGRDGARSVA